MTKYVIKNQSDLNQSFNVNAQIAVVPDKNFKLSDNDFKKILCKNPAKLILNFILSNEQKKYLLLFTKSNKCNLKSLKIIINKCDQDLIDGFSDYECKIKELFLLESSDYFDNKDHDEIEEYIQYFKDADIKFQLPNRIIDYISGFYEINVIHHQKDMDLILQNKEYLENINSRIEIIANNWEIKENDFKKLLDTKPIVLSLNCALKKVHIDLLVNVINDKNRCLEKIEIKSENERDIYEYLLKMIDSDKELKVILINNSFASNINFKNPNEINSSFMRNLKNDKTYNEMNL
jgi:hypothetical protein